MFTNTNLEDNTRLNIIQAINLMLTNQTKLIMNGPYLEEHEMKQLNEFLAHDHTINCWIATRIKKSSAAMACEGNVSEVLLKKLDESILPLVHGKAKTLKLDMEGKMTSGYYNDMEAGHPVFIDNKCIDDIIKEWLANNDLDGNLCYGPGEDDSHVNNPLKGTKVRVTFEIID